MNRERGRWFAGVVSIGLASSMCGGAPSSITRAVARLEAAGVAAHIDATAHLTIGEHEATLRAVSIGRGETRRTLTGSPAHIAGAEVRSERAPGVTEWWRALPSGLEHGVTLAERPAGEGALALELKVRGLTTRTASDETIELVHEGELVAQYAHLMVIDAHGARVPARMRASEVGIAIQIDDDGAVYPVVIDPLLVGWEATLEAPPGEETDDFGVSFALSASGDRALVYAGADDGMGLVRVFLRTGTSWAEEAVLVAADGEADDGFGRALALTASGDRALVGASGDDTPAGENVGSVHVFVRTGTSWAEEATLVPTDVEIGSAFGYSVALTASGDRALVGVWGDDVAGAVSAGSARVFSRTGSSWVEEAMLVAADGAPSDFFGTSVALAASGDRALVGAENDDVGPVTAAGSARVFVRTGTSWTEEATLLGNDPWPFDCFGNSVALTASGDRALVGEVGDDIPPDGNVGSVHVFLRTETSWEAEAVLHAPDAAAYENFGGSVALTASGDMALVGADAAWIPGIGRVHAFLRTGTSWAVDATLRAEGDPGFGSAVALTESGDRALVGLAQVRVTAASRITGSVRVYTFEPCDSCADAGMPDAGVADAGRDAGMDAGAAHAGRDAGMDAGVADAGRDAGDGGSRLDASVVDASARIDASTTPPASSGCGCRAGARFEDRLTGLSLLLLGLTLVRRVRRA